MLPGRTREYISGLSDEELTQYVAVGIDAYDADAGDFARAEFARRKLDGDHLAEVTSKTRAEIAQARAKESAVAATPLDGVSRITGDTMRRTTNPATRPSIGRVAGTPESGTDLAINKIPRIRHRR